MAVSPNRVLCKSAETWNKLPFRNRFSTWRNARGMLAECSRSGQFWHEVPPTKIKESIGYTSNIFHKTSLSNIVTVFNLAECSRSARGMLAEQRFSTSRNARGHQITVFTNNGFQPRGMLAECSRNAPLLIQDFCKRVLARCHIYIYIYTYITILIPN